MRSALCSAMGSLPASTASMGQQQHCLGRAARRWSTGAAAAAEGHLEHFPSAWSCALLRCALLLLLPQMWLQTCQGGHCGLALAVRQHFQCTANPGIGLGHNSPAVGRYQVASRTLTFPRFCFSQSADTSVGKAASLALPAVPPPLPAAAVSVVMRLARLAWWGWSGRRCRQVEAPLLDGLARVLADRQTLRPGTAACRL
jgi:hypothetical protein